MVRDLSFEEKIVLCKPEDWDNSLDWEHDGREMLLTKICHGERKISIAASVCSHHPVFEYFPGSHRRITLHAPVSLIVSNTHWGKVMYKYK